jgi:HEAT repeat protein
LLRYAGKSFEQWRNDLLTELKPELRVDGIKALAMFGANGYGAEAMRAILEVIEGYEYNPRGMDEESNAIYQAAVSACFKMGESAVPVLREGLRSPNRNVRRFAVAGLGQVGGPAAVPDILKFVPDKDAVMRLVAVEALRYRNSKGLGVEKALVGALKDENSQVREVAASALGGTGTKAAIPALVEALKDSDRSVRVVAMGSLQQLDGIQTSIAPALAPLLGDDDRNLRETASVFLTRMGPGARDAVPALIAVLQKKDSDARLKAVQILRFIGPDAKAAVPALKELLPALKGLEAQTEILKALEQIDK